MKEKFFLFLILLSMPVFSEEKKEEPMDFSVKPFSEIGPNEVKEGSSLTASRNHEKVLWTLNDSGNPAVLYPVDTEGKGIKPEWMKAYKGVKVTDAVNIDWEWVISDDKGNLLIGDTGNNNNYRKDLAVYLLAEPNPYYAAESGIIAKFPVRYPDQKDFPPGKDNMNFDAEAAYYQDGGLYVISKNRSDTLARIYRFGELKPWQTNVPEIAGIFDFGAMVTDAEVSPDGRYLAVLTYDYIWVFEKPVSGDFFKGKASKKQIKLGQCEGVAFSGGDLLISNEQRNLFKIALKEILK